MGSTENFHQEIMRRIRSNELHLGVDRSFTSNPKSIAFSRFWTLFSFCAAAGTLGIMWQLDGPWWAYLAGPAAAFLAGSIIGFIRGGSRVRKLATTDSLAFDTLWSEGALSLKLPSQEAYCISPSGDYRAFIAHYFLRSKT